MTSKMPVDEKVVAGDAQTKPQHAYQRVLIAVADASQVGPVVELARRTDVGEVRVLHLNLRESYGGRRFPLENDATASYAAEAAVFELRMAGLGASGLVKHALIGKAAEAITAEAAEWGADLIILGPARRGQLTSRLRGSATLGVLKHAPCPVLVAAPADKDGQHRAEENTTPVAAR